MSSATPEKILRALSPGNCRLLAIIGRHHPENISELCRLALRSQPNVSRSLAALEEAGVISMVGSRTRRPVLVSSEVVIDLAALQSD